MAAAIMGDATIAIGSQKHHLSFPAIRTQGPSVAEYHRLSCAPVLVIDLHTVFRRNRAHCLPSLLFAGMVNLSCPSNDQGHLQAPLQKPDVA
jgi:hypothetical protein